jgi:hypothetical protein
VTKRGATATAKQRAALDAGRAAKADAIKKAKAEGRPKAKDRWAALLSGGLLVSDLEDEELKRMQLRNAGGTFGGKPHAIPSHIAQKMRAEWLKRGNSMLESYYHDAIKVLHQVATSPDAKEGDAIRAASIIVERVGGKVPETVRVITEEDPWGATLADGVDDDRSMADFAAEDLIKDLES